MKWSANETNADLESAPVGSGKLCLFGTWNVRKSDKVMTINGNWQLARVM